jgi:hypothetical protein
MRRFGTRGIATLLAVLVLAIAGAGWYLLIGPGRPGGDPGAVLVDLSGSAAATSESFVAREGWQIVWETEADHFTISIDGDVPIGTAVDQAGPGSGITFPVPEGTFSLSVDADGPWSLRVTQGP